MIHCSTYKLSIIACCLCSQRQSDCNSYLNGKEDLLKEVMELYSLWIAQNFESSL